MQMLLVQGMQVINDTYNANPASLTAALDVLAIQPGIKVLVIGDMGELGENSAEFHMRTGVLAREKDVDLCFSLGDQSALVAESFGKGGFSFTDPKALVAALKSELRSKRGRPVSILVKGSRAMKMERVVDLLEHGAGA